MTKADALASDSLTKVDEKFPIVKSDTEKIKSSVLDLAFLPFRVASDGKNYVLDTYGSEYKKCGANGYVSSGKAVITTSMVVTSDTLSWIMDFLSAKKQEGQDFASKKYQQGSEYAEKGAGYVSEKKDAAMGFASEKAEQVKELDYQKGRRLRGSTRRGNLRGRRRRGSRMGFIYWTCPSLFWVG